MLGHLQRALELFTLCQWLDEDLVVHQTGATTLAAISAPIA
jgi:hypothetical protein